MYLAGFECGSGAFLSAAIGVAGGATADGGWAALLDAHPRVDLSLRVSRRRDGSRDVLFLLAADASQGDELKHCQAALVRRFSLQGLLLPADSAAFDRLVGSVPKHQLRVSHDGYHHRGEPLACEFRLHAAERPAGECCIQVVLRRHLPNAEIERRVRKHLARLKLERPFTEHVRAMQQALVERLLRPGWIADEYLACSDAVALAAVRAQIERQFAGTGGRVGFAEPPLEEGLFDDWLVTGCHRAREGGAAAHPATQGAALFDAAEVDWLVNHAFAPGTSQDAHDVARTPQVFISYASSDFSHATELCEVLEGAGVPCWIAPRDIGRELLPYTEAIARSMGQVRAVVVVLSAMANRSVHIPRELDLALERKLPIVPVRVDDVRPSGQLKYLLSTCQWLDAFEREGGAVAAELLQRLAT